MTVIFVERAEAVVLVHHIVHLQLRRQALPYVLRLLLVADAVDAIGTGIVGNDVFLQRLAMTIATSPERGGDVETARAVVHIKVIGQSMAVLVYSLGVVVEAEAVALCFFQRDAHHSLCRCGIAGTWILDDIDVLNLVRAQAREFLHILHPSAVDIHLGIAAPQHLHGAVSLSLERGNLRQGIAYRSSFLQYRAGNCCTHGVALNMSLRQLPTYHYLAEQLSVLLHLDGKVLVRVYI